MDTEKKTVLVVDDNPANLRIIITSLKDDYRLIPFTSGKDAHEFFNKGRRCDLILLDVDMPEMNGFETIKLFKHNPDLRDIPVIFLTGLLDPSNEMEGLSLGAVDYIRKPFSPPLIKKRIDMYIALEEYNRHLGDLVKRKTTTIEKLSDVTIFTIVTMVGSRDHETGGHINRTSNYVVVLAEQLVRAGLFTRELTKANIDMLKRSAPLHDIGKVGIDDKILKKPDKLAPEEFNAMKEHTIIGGSALGEARQMMDEPSFLDIASVLALCHHEKWDGSGYPRGLKGEDIPLFARIMAIADVYDALISVRPYKKAFSHEEAVSIMMQGSGTHFDPRLTEAFEAVHEEFNAIARRFADQ